MTTTLSAGANSSMNVAIQAVGGNYGIFGNGNLNSSQHAFGFNIAGSAPVTITNLTSGFSYVGGPASLGGGYGDFEFIINGPQQGANATLPLLFTVNRAGGFATDTSLFAVNDDGYYAAAHLRFNNDGNTGFVASNGLDTTVNTAAVPEPATMMLLGTGLVVAFRNRKRR